MSSTAINPKKVKNQSVLRNLTDGQIKKLIADSPRQLWNRKFIKKRIPGKLHSSLRTIPKSITKHIPGKLHSSLKTISNLRTRKRNSSLPPTSTAKLPSAATTTTTTTTTPTPTLKRKREKSLNKSIQLRKPVRQNKPKKSKN